MKFTLSELPYAYDGLAPVINEETMHVHHDKHHQGYCNNLNAICDELGLDYTDETINDLIATINSDAPAKLRNNLGGYVNHNIYWENLAPGGVAISDRLKEILLEDGETMEDLRTALVDLGMSQFASGWAWLAVGEDGKVARIKTPNQDHPMMPKTAEDLGGLFHPILTLDVWEHAYYLDHQNRRKEYLEQIFDLINWEVVEARYDAAMSDK